MTRILIGDKALHRTTSHILGANRNHLSDEANLAGKMEAYKKIKPRFGEGRKLYRLGHGPTDGRLDEPHRYMTGYHFEEYWDKPGPYPYDDLRYGLKEARAMDCDLTVVVNYGSGTPEEAGRLASYLNKKDDPVRNAHGDAPWNVTYFELGNEVTWHMQVGHDPHCLSPQVYARRCKAFAAEMRKNSDIPIKIGLVGCTNGSWVNDDWPNDESGERVHNIEAFFEFMGDDLDFITYHGYPQFDKNDFELMCCNQWFCDKLSKKVFPTIRESEKRFGLTHPVEVANSEYFTMGYASPHCQATLEGLYTADTLVTCLNLNVKMAVSFCFSFHNKGKSSAQDLFFLDSDPGKPSALFRVQELAAETLGDWVLETEVRDAPSTPMAGLDDGAVCHLACASTRRADGSVVLFAVNRMETEAICCAVEPGFKPSSVEMITLHGGRYDNKEMKREVSAPDSLERILFPPASVSAVICRNK